MAQGVVSCGLSILNERSKRKSKSKQIESVSVSPKNKDVNLTQQKAARRQRPLARAIQYPSWCGKAAFLKGERVFNIHYSQVTSIQQYGAFVELPGFSKHGLHLLSVRVHDSDTFLLWK